MCVVGEILFFFFLTGQFLHQNINAETHLHCGRMVLGVLVVTMSRSKRAFPKRRHYIIVET